LLEVAQLSPVEFVEREFENDAIRAGLLFFNGLREIDLRLPGFGHSIPALLAGPHKAQMCIGGSARLAEALVADIREHGGEIRTGTGIRAILMRAGRAAGVELDTGERIEARSFVVSGLNPQQTFLELLDADAVPQDVRERARGFEYNLLAPLFALNLALNEPPHYKAAQRRPELARAFMVILGLERFSQFSEIVRAHEQGEIPPPVMWGACPTLFDASQAPPGKHTAFLWEKLPYALHGSAANWDAEKEKHARRALARWSDFAPNLAEGAVLDWFCRAPTSEHASRRFAGGIICKWSSRLQPAVRRSRGIPRAGGRSLPVRRLDASWRKYHGLVRLQCGGCYSGGPRAAAVVAFAQR
jgi:phytoene dehydrogenase-like protein